MKIRYAMTVLAGLLVAGCSGDGRLLAALLLPLSAPLLASIHVVRGETESAGTACRQLHTSGPLIILTCHARVALATGQHELALPQLLGVLNVVDAQHIPPPVLAWSYSVAGDLAVANAKAQEAEKLCRQSLALDDLRAVNEKVRLEFDSWIADENWLHAREMARYFVDVVGCPELARHLALINVSLQQEPEDLLLEWRTRATTHRT